MSTLRYTHWQDGDVWLGKPGRGQLPQLVIDKRQQQLGGLGIALLDLR